MKKQPEEITLSQREKARRYRNCWAALVLIVCALPLRAYAADDPLRIVNNLSDFIFSCIRAIGIIILGWGIVQV